MMEKQSCGMRDMIINSNVYNTMKAAVIGTISLLVISFIIGHYVYEPTERFGVSTSVHLVLEKEVGTNREGDSVERYDIKAEVSTHESTDIGGNRRGTYLDFAHFSVYDPDSKRHTMAKAKEIAKEYDINYETFLCVLNGESGIESVSRVDGTLKCGDNGASCGLGQIKCPTWQSIRRHAGWDTDCSLRADDEENLKTTAYGLATVWKYHWTAYRNCEALGYSL